MNYSVFGGSEESKEKLKEIYSSLPESIQNLLKAMADKIQESDAIINQLKTQNIQLSQQLLMYQANDRYQTQISFEESGKIEKISENDDDE